MTTAQTLLQEWLRGHRMLSEYVLTAGMADLVSEPVADIDGLQKDIADLKAFRDQFRGLAICVPPTETDKMKRDARREAI